MLSPHFSEDELNHTDHAIVNVCPPELMANARRLAGVVLEPLRSMVGPLRVNSWYRGIALNKAVGGEASSAHLEGRAADVVPNGNVFNAFKMLVASDIPYDKIIFEHHNSDWIHIQIRGGGLAPRRLAFTAKPNAKGKMVYEAYNG